MHHFAWLYNCILLPSCPFQLSNHSESYINNRMKTKVPCKLPCILHGEDIECTRWTTNSLWLWFIFLDNHHGGHSIVSYGSTIDWCSQASMCIKLSLTSHTIPEGEIKTLQNEMKQMRVAMEKREKSDMRVEEALKRLKSSNPKSQTLQQCGRRAMKESVVVDLFKLDQDQGRAWEVAEMQTWALATQGKARSRH